MSDDVEYFGAVRPVPPAEACRSLAGHLGVSEAEARSLLERGTAAAAIETRGPWLCSGCGGSKPYRSSMCRCGAPAEDAQRDRPMPKLEGLDGAEGLAQIRRRYYLPV